MEPNNQKTSPEPAFSNIPISSHTPQVISPTFNQAHPQPAASVAESAELPSSQSNPGPNATAEPASTLPMMPISKRSAGGRFSRFKNKKFILSGAAALLVLVSAGIVFGWYIPNKPETVYKRGLDRSGQALEKFIMDSMEEDRLKKLENSQLNGSFDSRFGENTYSATFSSIYDPKLSNSSLDAKFKTDTSEEKKIGLKLLTDMPDGAYLPNIYFKLSGLATLGIDGYYPSINDYDNKWISITSEYLQSFIPKEEGADTMNPSHEDSKELATIVIRKTREYLLTNNTEKAVLENKQFVGTEMSEGLKANRYTVGINKTNAKKYCLEMSSELLASAAYKRFTGLGDEAVTQQKKSMDGMCNSRIDEIGNESTFDLWIDKKLKLIHKVRFSEKQDKGTYFEVGQIYKGGDKLPLFINFKSDKEEYTGRFDLETDLKQYITTGKLDVKNTGADPFSAKLEFTFKPHSGEVKIEKPADAIPIQEILQTLGGGMF